MYYLLIPNSLQSRLSLYQVTSDKYLCIGRTTPTGHGQCNFTDVSQMHTLYFHTDDRHTSPEGISKLLNREHYRFDSYPDVANLHLTYPEIFL